MINSGDRGVEYTLLFIVDGVLRAIYYPRGGRRYGSSLDWYGDRSIQRQYTSFVLRMHKV